MKIKKKLSKTAILEKQKNKRASYIERIENKTHDRMLAMIYSTNKYYYAITKNATDKVLAKYEKKRLRRIVKIEKQYKTRKNRLIKVKIYKKEVKKLVCTDAKMKSKALSEAQKYAKLRKAFLGLDQIIRIGLVDKLGAFSKLDRKVNGGHVYGQRNFPHMAFEIDNIRPISGFANKMQGDQIAQWKEYLPENIQKRLYLMSIDKEAKNKIRDRKYFEEQYEKFKSLNKIEEERLGMNK